MIRINTAYQPMFKGAWGDIQNLNEKSVIHYYPCIDETSDEIQREVSSKLKDMEKTDRLWWVETKQKIEAIVAKPLNVTKADFEKLNRGFLSDTLAKLLMK